MKLEITVHAYVEHVGQQVFEDLAKYDPKCLKYGVFEYKEMEGSATKSLLESLEKYGCRPWMHQGQRANNEYHLTLRRVYDEADYRAARYLNFIGLGFHDPADTTSGTPVLQVDPPFLKKYLPFAMPDWPRVIVSDKLRGLMEAAQLKGAMFEPIEIVGRGKEKFKEPIWELTSNVMMPPLSTACMLEGDETMRPYEEGKDAYCSVASGHYTRAEYHYDEKKIRPLEPFDVAVTHERMGRVEWNLRELVVSQRFYQFCQEHKLKVEDWFPVVVDP
jgi:hypothetical protein